MFTSQPPAKYFSGINANSEYNFNSTSIWNLRSCYSGEKYYNGLCVSCPNGTYSLVYSESQGCLACPLEAADCYASNINLLPGYWRNSVLSDIIFTCPYMGCKGGYGVGEALCDDGYEGVLCAVCSSGYHYSENSKQCMQCHGTKVMSTTIIVILVVVFVGLLGLSLYAYFKFVKTVSSDSDEVDESLLARLKVKADKFYKRIGPVMTKMKIIISTFQILSVSLASFKISMPVSYRDFIGGLGFLSFDVMNVMPLGCIKRLNFLDTLIAKTLFPPLFVALLFVCFMAELSVRSRKVLREYMSEPRQLKVFLLTLIRDLKFRYISLTLLFSYLYLPSLTVSIFQTFICKNVDPGNTISSNGDYYLVADYSMNCASASIKFLRVWASFMILLYPIGVPALYLWLLYKKRYEIIHRYDAEQRVSHLSRDTVRTEGEQKTSVKMYKFLYDSYRPEFWYFELVETSRRLILTGVLSVTNAGSSGQVVFGIILAVFYMKVYAFYQPYELEESSLIAELAQYQIFFSFFGSLIVQNSLLAPSYNNLIGGLMVVLNMSAALLSMYYEYSRSKKVDADESIAAETADSGTVHLELPETPNPLLHRIDVEKAPTIVEQLVEKYITSNTRNSEVDVIASKVSDSQAVN